MNNNLTFLKGGAPQIISLRDTCPNAVITTQFSSRLRELRLRDESENKCTTRGGIATAAALLEQLVTERDTAVDGSLFPDYDGMRSHMFPAIGANLAPMWKAVGGNAVTLPAFDYTPQLFSGTTYKPDKMWWSIHNVIEAQPNAKAEIGADGRLVVTGGYCYVTIRGYLRSDKTKMADYNIIVGVDSLTSADAATCPVGTALKSSAFRSALDASFSTINISTFSAFLEAMSRYPEFVKNVAAYPQVLSVLAEDRRYISHVVEYPNFIHSIAATDKRSYLTQMTDSNSGYIDTGIVASADMAFNVIANTSITGGTNYLFGGGGGTAANCMYIYHNLNSGNKRAYFRYGGTENSQTNAAWNDGWHENYVELQLYGVDETRWLRNANVSAFVEQPLCPIALFGAMRNSNGTSYTRNTTAGNEISIERATIRKGEDTHIFVPFVRGGVAGMIDLFDLSFHSNGHTAGEFEAHVENR